MKRLGILIVAYNAASTLAQVLDRIPRDFIPRIERVLVSDDASTDATYLVGLGYQQQSDLPLTVISQPENLGYGGNQKAAYHWAMEHGLDIVVLLHGDGQYAPEVLPSIVEPLELDKCDAVLGSRMMEPGGARRGGMPLYKFVGNKILTRLENAVVGMDLSEWHTGYRAYSLAALRDLPFDGNSDGFDFDTQIIVQLHEAGKRIVEVPIPTYYGGEISYVNGMQYAYDIVRHVLRYRAHKMGFGTGETAFASSAYEMKEGAATSHGRLLAWMAARQPARVLDLGCSDGKLAEALRVHGHRVTGVDRTAQPGVEARVERFVAADLDAGIPDEVGDGYDVVLAADVFEHVREPEQLLAQARTVLAPGGSVMTSVPNFAHWYPRVRVAAGRFDYDRRGILDRDHLRFFTRRSFEHLARGAGYAVRRREAVGLPLEVVERGGATGGGAGEGTGTGAMGGGSADRHRRSPSSRGRPEGNGLGRGVQRLDHLAVAAWPSLFAYQYLFELEPVTT